MTKANWVEKAIINNFMWAHIQRRRIIPLWRASVELGEGSAVLEVGCGRGVGAAMIYDEFKPMRVDAFDVDEDMIRKAKKYLAGEYDGLVNAGVGDVTMIDAKDGVYDAVFDSFILHHVEDWYKGVSEVSRVLKPGGYFAFAELYADAISKSYILSNIFHHPTENRFEREQFVRALAENGLRLMERKSLLQGFGIIGVARKIQ